MNLKTIIKGVILVAAIVCITIFVTPTVEAWYGAGQGTWAHTIDGLTGKVVDPLYKHPSASYDKNEVITINFEIQNPAGNSSMQNKPLFLKIFKIAQSPKSRDLTGNDAANVNSIGENELYINNSASNDNQYPYKVLSVGNLIVAPGETAKFSSQFVITESGYYQFDLTDQDGNTAYAPGHIYAAGFLRVVNPSSGGSSNNNNSSNSNSSSNQSNSSQPKPSVNIVRGFVAPLGIAGTILDSAANIEASIKGTHKQVQGKVLNSPCANCYALPILLGEFLALVGHFVIVKKKKIKHGVLKSSVIPVVAFVIFTLINRVCSTNNIFCNYFLSFDALIFLGTILYVARPKRKFPRFPLFSKILPTQ